MDPRIRLETVKFNRYLQDLQRSLQGVPIDRIIDYELGKILTVALAKTDSASVDDIRDAHDHKEWTTLNGKKYKLRNHYPDPLWRSITEQRKQNLVRRLNARGMAKQSFLALSRLIGVEIYAPNYVASAWVPGHSNDENVDIKRIYGEFKYGIVITDESPLLRWSHAKSAFIGALIGRQKFYAKNLSKGVFDSADKVAKKYPGLGFRY